MSATFEMICGAIASEPWFERFVFFTALGLFVAWIVGMLSAARFVAIPAAACLAAFFQVMFVWADSTEWLYGSPLYSRFLTRVLACLVAVGLAVVGTDRLLRPPSSSVQIQLARAALLPALAAAFASELLHVMTRLLAFFPDSPSLNQTWEKGLIPTLVVFAVAWFATYSCFREADGPSCPGQNAAGSAIGPGTTT